MFDEERISRILSAAYERRDSVLLETDGFEILRALGFKTCPSIFVRDAQEARAADWNSFSGDKVVVKVVSPDILHKSDVGGVAIVANDREAIASTIEAMAARLRGKQSGRFHVSTSSSLTTPRSAENYCSVCAARTTLVPSSLSAPAASTQSFWLRISSRVAIVAILSCELAESDRGPGAVRPGQTRNRIDNSFTATTEFVLP